MLSVQLHNPCGRRSGSKGATHNRASAGSNYELKTFADIKPALYPSSLRESGVERGQVGGRVNAAHSTTINA
jgi:hypothetical protein